MKSVTPSVRCVAESKLTSPAVKYSLPLIFFWRRSSSEEEQTSEELSDDDVSDDGRFSPRVVS